MKISFVISNIFFIAFVIALAITIIFFEIGLRAFRKSNEKKSKESNALGFRWLIISLGLLTLSILFSFFKF
ncbi:hypothetical protein [Fervidobacterium sp. 2310opik-2]|uniref:hypothetical protein n=1 Tax=Fervidobacterium sp. 2310opik-2 TaxID=1755815 RepID=UPI0013DF71F8|nr:hypothetical protein [Fervidobacterium sp. 2310opik-2]KAF2961601.1 hypothetical protein AS161_08620 [Fervidobacterium sp. 2310opik-2]